MRILGLDVGDVFISHLCHSLGRAHTHAVTSARILARAANKRKETNKKVTYVVAGTVPIPLRPSPDPIEGLSEPL